VWYRSWHKNTNFTIFVEKDMKQWTLKGKCALITGGTKGIGLATAEEMLALGAEVMIIARDAAAVEARVSAWQESGLPASGMAADVCNPDDQARVAAAIEAQWSRLDVLVNNVGMNIRKGFEAYAEAEYRRIFDTNLFSVMALTQRLFPLLRNGNGPSVIQVSSVAATVDVRSGAPYGMTKAAQLQLTRNLAVEWAPHGIRVNAVSPWYTRTPLAAPVLEQPERLAQILRRTPAARIAEAEEPAAAIAFLAMDKASYITGQNIIVDGGMTISGL
jgi:tropinone reductase I